MAWGRSRASLAAGLAATILLSALIFVAPAFALEEPDIIFYSSFNSETTFRADRAAGSPDATAVGSPEHASAGRYGRCLRAFAASGIFNYLQYAAAGNLLTETAGAVSLWFKPDNWILDYTRRAEWFGIPNNGLSFYCIPVYGIEYHYNGLFILPYLDDTADWHHATLVWGEDDMRFFIDGYKLPDWRDVNLLPAASTFHIGGDAGEDGLASLIDEFYSFGRRLADSEAKNLYRSCLYTYPPPEIAVRAATTAVTPDGSLTEDAWTTAARTTGFMSDSFGDLISESGSAYVTHDASNLYFAVESQVLDGIYEVYIDRGLGTYARMAVDEAGFKTCENIGINDWTTGGAIANGIWTVEFAVPFSALGMSAPAEGQTLGFNVRIVNDASAGRAATLAYMGRNAAMSTARFGTITFSGTRPCVALGRTGNIAGDGNLDLDFSIHNPTATNKQVVVSAVVRPNELDYRSPTDPDYPMLVDLVRNYADTIIVPAGGTSPAGLQDILSSTDLNILDIEVRETGQAASFKRSIFFTGVRLVALDIDYYFTTGTADATTDVRDCYGYAADQLEGVTYFLDSADNILLTQNISGFTGDPDRADGTARVTFNLSGYAAGSYKFRTEVKLKSTGETVATKTEPFDKLPLPAWYTDPLGAGNAVLPGFSALMVNGETVSCWGRDIACGDSLLPTQITSQSAGILAAPMRLKLTVGGNDYTVSAGEATVTETHEYQVALDTSAAAAGLNFSAHTRIDFDGQIKVDLTIAPADGPVTVEALDFEAPMKQENASLYYVTGAIGRGDGRGGGAVGDGISFAYEPFFWLGDDTRGLCWISESPKNYSLTAGKNTPGLVAAVRNGAETIMRVKFIDKSTVIAAPRRITFALEPTPVKSRPPNWRLWNTYHNDMVCYAWWDAGYEHFADLGELHAETELVVLGQTINNYLDRCDIIPDNNYALYYACNSQYTGVPNFEYYQPEFMRLPYSMGLGEDGLPFLGVCPRGPYSDYALNDFHNCIQQQNWDGFYLDMAGVTPCCNTTHGCGYYDDSGILQTEYPIFAAREWRRRVANLLSARHGKSFLWEHMSSTIMPNVQAFSTILMDGEEMNDTLYQADLDYINIYGLNGARAMLAKHQFGGVGMLLPEIRTADPVELKSRTENMLTLVMLHDGLVCNSYCDTTVVDSACMVRDDFPIYPGEVEFLPYWNNSSRVWVTTQADSVKVSAYRRPGSNKALLVMGNITDNDLTVEVRFDLAQLGIADYATALAYDPLAGQTLPLSYGPNQIQGIQNVTVNRKNYRMIVIEDRPVVAFTPPTPADGATLPAGTFDFSGVVTAAPADLSTISWNFGGATSLFDDKLVLMYNLDGNSALGETGIFVRDCSSYRNYNNGAIRGGAAYVAGRYGNALSLDGFNGRVAVAHNDRFLYRGQDRTIACWVRTHESEANGGEIFSKPWNGGGNYSYRLHLMPDSYGSTLQFVLGGGDGVNPQTYVLATDTGISESQWHYLVVTLDSARNVKIYIDGQLAKEGTHSISSWTPVGGVGDDPLMLGTIYEYGASYPHWDDYTYLTYDGDIDEFRMFDRVMDASEVARQYRCNLRWATATQCVLESTLPLTNGSYTYALRACDRWSGETTVAQRTLTVDIPPTVELNPAPEALYLAPSSIALMATAADSDGTVDRVEFYEGTSHETYLGQDTSAPYSYNWTSPAAGKHILWARAVDNDGGSAWSASTATRVWATQDIGTAGGGSATYSNGTFTVAGRGSGIVNSSDSFRFVYLPMNGDCAITARITSVSNSYFSNGRVGVMLRQDAAAGARELSSLLRTYSTDRYYLHYRTMTDGDTDDDTKVSAASPWWVRVVRTGDSFQAYWSSDGSSFTPLGSPQTISMGGSVLAGLAVTSGYSYSSNTAVIDSVSVTP